MVEKLKLETITAMSRFLNPPQPMQLGEKVNELIDYVQTLQEQIDKLSPEKFTPDSGPIASNIVPETGRSIPRKKTLN